ncbi:MAG: cupin domain-containing protein [Sphingobium sp.]
MPGLPVTRRVVTGLDPQGRSAIVLDGPVPGAARNVQTIWSTDSIPADNGAGADSIRDFSFDLMHSGASAFIQVRMPPGPGSAPMHATDTIDYITMLSGSVTILLETGETVLHAGDMCVDRGIVHGWRNDGMEDAVYSVVTIPAHPVGAGRTV